MILFTIPSLYCHCVLLCSSRCQADSVFPVSLIVMCLDTLIVLFDVVLVISSFHLIMNLRSLINKSFFLDVGYSKPGLQDYLQGTATNVLVDCLDYN